MINLEHLTVKDQDEVLLKDINLNLKAPFRIGIVGSSGSGKSTLAKALSLLLDSHLTIEGKLFYQNENLFDLPEKKKRAFRRKHLKYLVQEPFFALNPYLKIKTQLKEALDEPADDEKLLGHLQTVGLDDRRILNAHPLELSGGQRQRISFLQAILQRPEVLIADEPTTALDPIKQKEILALLIQYLDTNQSSLIFVSHDLNATCQITDWIYVMHEGQIIESLCSKKFFETASHPFTQSMIQSLFQKPKNESFYG